MGVASAKTPSLMKTGVALVVYGSAYLQYHAVERLQRAFQGAECYIINNRYQGEPGEIEGHNRQFEFGAYLQALEHFKGYDRLLLLNDTAFSSHSFFLWRGLWQKAWYEKTNAECCVWGDLRFDGSSIVERPNPFAASWCMMALNQASVRALANTLEEVLSRESEPLSPAYEAFLQDWLTGRASGGWHGNLSAENLVRKRQCIVWEHAWSRVLQEAGVELYSFRSFGFVRHLLARFFDRLQNRYRALRR